MRDINSMFNSTDTGETGAERTAGAVVRKALLTLAIAAGAGALLVSATVVILTAVLMFLAFGDAELPGWEARSIPGKIVTTGVIASSHARGGLLEGCQSAVLRLAPSTISAINRENIRFFDDIAPLSGTLDFRTWHRTPAQAHVFAAGAINGCGDDGNPALVFDPLNDPGGYYSLTGNAEGMIVVRPDHGIVLFLYFG